jgi:hypothetical protein
MSEGRSIGPGPLGAFCTCVICGSPARSTDPKCPNPDCSSHNEIKSGPYSPPIQESTQSQLDRIEQKLERIETELAHLGSMLHE